MIPFRQFIILHPTIFKNQPKNKMTNLIIQKLQKLNLKKAPKIEPGMTVRVHQKIKEGEKERIQVFEGLVLKVSAGHGIDKTFTVRKIVDGIGVEKIFPINSPHIDRIEITKKSKIRRAKLYYMRERFGKSARLKGRFLTEAEKNKEMEDSAADLAEEQSQEAEGDPVTENVSEANEEKGEEAPATEEAAPATEEAPKEEEEAPEAPAEEPKPEEEAPAPEEAAPAEEEKSEESSADAAASDEAVPAEEPKKEE